jgi:diguanylate cyclase (GGDEF)-like protein
MTPGLGERVAASARLRFRAFGMLVASLFACSFAVVCVQLHNIASEADRLDDAWIASTKILGELSDRLTELRLSQALLLLAPDERSAQEIKALAAEHRRVLTESQLAIADSAALHSLANTRDLFRSVGAYLAAEREWERHPDAHDQFDGTTKRLYDAADEAVDSLIEANAAAAQLDTSRISRTSNTLLVVIVIIGVLVCSVKFWTMQRLDVLVFRPLERITGALTRLASGVEDTEFPPVHRKDEIGGLIHAFQHFRHHAEALREAYVATKLAEESAARLARHDPLTGLFNRRHLSNRIDALAAASAGRTHYLYVIDLDRFKPVNDLYGHATGDIVLCAIADRLRALMSDQDVVARPGGDEFAILASFGVADAEYEARALAERISETICTPLETGTIRIEVGGSIGIAQYGRDGADADSLVRSADAAMYRAKARPCTGYQFFEESMREALRQEAALEVDVRAAVASRAIRPHYQPLVNLATREIYGFEVLARWTHPQRGNVAPDSFIPVVERLGLATVFMLGMLRQACRDARTWPGSYSIAVNVSPQQLVDALLPTQILSVLTEENFPPEKLEIELTESALVADIEAAKMTIDNFRRWGIRVSLDDFGTGYSSLHHLRELRFDKVKIDKSFVQSMLSNAESEKIVDAILNLTEGLNLSALAEGIETVEIEEALRRRGCPYGQGYLFGKAVASDEVPRVLEQSRQSAFMV